MKSSIITVLLPLVAAWSLVACDRAAHAIDPADNNDTPTTRKASAMRHQNIERADKIVKSEEEWKKILTPEQFQVLRLKGTERACSGELWQNKEKGVYTCAGCGLELFASDTKFESGTGWPSYFNPVGPDRIHIHADNSYGMVRDEVVCARCGGHLGHVFNDGPPPTGLRFCINSVSMKFVTTGDNPTTAKAEAAKSSE